MKRILLIVLVFATSLTYAQDTTNYWKTKGSLTFNFNQSYFSNWSAGGDNSLAGLPKFNYQASYAKDKISWDNKLNLALGYTVTGNSKAMKSDDLIELYSLFGYKMKKNWYATIMLKFSSQFAKGYDYGVDSSTYVSKFMAPAYLDFGPGIAYKLPDWLTINVSPLTARMTFVNDQDLADAGSFGLDPAIVDSNGNIVTHASKTKFQLGAKLTAAIQYEIFKNVTLGTSLELFSDYLHNPQDVIVNWKTLVRMKVNSWLNVDFNTELFYDKSVKFYDAAGVDLGSKVQLKQNLMVGIGISF
ncbi:MAG: hypothetical protein DRJ09_02335 [Bacteroidetes bacterium]|nr:MAG: hypothetical protein DRJ09_02335 [Bacteroidota bacterium]